MGSTQANPPGTTQAHPVAVRALSVEDIGLSVETDADQGERLLHTGAKHCAVPHHHQEPQQVHPYPQVTALDSRFGLDLSVT